MKNSYTSSSRLHPELVPAPPSASSSIFVTKKDRFGLKGNTIAGTFRVDDVVAEADLGEGPQAVQGYGVLEARGLPLTQLEQERVERCTDVAVLRNWTKRAATASAAEDIFTGGAETPK